MASMSNAAPRRPRSSLLFLVSATALWTSFAALRGEAHKQSAGARTARIGDGEKTVPEADDAMPPQLERGIAMPGSSRQGLYVPLTRRARSGGPVYGVDVGELGITRRRLAKGEDISTQNGGKRRRSFQRCTLCSVVVCSGRSLLILRCAKLSIDGQFRHASISQEPSSYFLLVSGTITHG